MRVITGELRGKRLVTVPGNDLVRPTSEKVKEAIFSSIQFDIEGRNVLDLFAGSGQLGIEALSRGAESTTFVDASNVSLDVVRQNLKGTVFEKTAKLVKRDFTSFLNTTNEMFDIAFLDPPYNAGILLKAAQLCESHINLNGTVFCEHPTEIEMPQNIGKLTMQRQYRYGNIVVTAYKKEG